MKRNRLMALIALLLTLGLVAAACGDDDDSSTATGDESADTTETTDEANGAAEGDDIVAEAEQMVQELTATTGVEFPQPDEAFDIGQRRVAIISCGQAGIGCQQMSQFATEAAEAAGWEASPTFDGEFDPAKQAAFVEQAINEGYDAIVLASIDANSISAALDAAAAADVPVACIMCENVGFAGEIIDTTTSGKPGGEAIGWFVIAASGGQGSAIGFHDRAFPIVTERMAGIQEVLAQCSGCSYEEVDIPTTDLNEPGPPTWTGVLSANPAGSFDFALAPYDFFSIPMAVTAEEQGRTEIQITGFDAWSDMVDAIAAGDQLVTATVAAPFEYASWAAIDQVGRVLAGLDTWDATQLPVRLVTSANASEFSDGYYRPDFDVQEFFLEQWNLA